MVRSSKIILILALLTITGSVVGCTPKGYVAPETELLAGDTSAAPIPLGVERFCWEEPLVQFEQNGPGLDVEGRWYHPSYVAVREVRQGRWRPCKVVPNEIKGDLKNER